MSDKTPPNTDAGKFATALIETARDAARESAQKITQPDKNVEKTLRDLYETAFVDGAMHILKNELDQRIADTFAQMSRRERRAAQRKSKK